MSCKSQENLNKSKSFSFRKSNFSIGPLKKKRCRSLQIPTPNSKELHTLCTNSHTIDPGDQIFSYLLENSEEPFLETAFTNQSLYKCCIRTRQTIKVVHTIPLRMLEQAYGVPFMHPTRSIKIKGLLLL